MPTRLMVVKDHGTGFHQRLKGATRPAHRRLEAQLPLLDNGLTITEYRQLLRTYYGLYVPLESALHACQLPALRGELACRRKSWWLLDDLLALGETHQAIAALPICQAIPPILSQADMLGALYVVEGATLGSQVILRGLRRSLGASAEQYSRFFRSYGSHVLQMWAAFLRILEAGAYDLEQEELIIESACRTFISFEGWFAANHTHAQTHMVCDEPDMRMKDSGMSVVHSL